LTKLPVGNAHTARSGTADFEPWHGIALFLVFAGVRTALSLAWPAGGGDTQVYELVASNILHNGCVSLSPPTGSACVPHWGGNQLPGYPAFISAAWALFGQNEFGVRFLQGLIAAAAAVWAGACAGRLAQNRRVGVAVALLLGLSPLGLPWSRFELTDALTIAATQWVAAELLLALHLRRLRPVPVAIALTVAVLLRYDSVFLALPVALTAWAARRDVRDAMLRLALIAALCAVPPGAWWVRSVLAGLPAVPDVAVMPDGGPTPAGYIRWGNSWMIDQYEYPAWNYPIYARMYSLLSIPDHAYLDEHERNEVAALLAELRPYEGRPMPDHIDAAFAALAARKYEREPTRHYVALPLRRAAIMWADPRYSGGWPVSVNDAAGKSAAQLLVANPLAATVKVGGALYRTLLLVTAGALLAVRRIAWARPLLLFSIAYAAAQTVFHVAFGLVETRYLLSAVSFLELAVAAVAIAWMLARRSKTTRS
jgi:hypothetical protein